MTDLSTVTEIPGPTNRVYAEDIDEEMRALAIWACLPEHLSDEEILSVDFECPEHTQSMDLETLTSRAL